MKLIFATLSTVLISTSVSAFDISGAEIGLSYSTPTDGTGSPFVYADGAIELGFGKVSVQIDASVFNWTTDTEVQSTIIVHGIYNINNNFAVGAFVGVEDWRDYEGIFYRNLGVEVRYTLNNIPLSFEASWLNTTGFEANPYIADIFDISVTYDITDNITVLASITQMSDESSNDQIYRVGAEYMFENGISIMAGYKYSESDELFGFSIRKTFGEGVTFERKDWGALVSGI